MPQGIIIPKIDPATIAQPPAGTISLVADLNSILTVIKDDGTIVPINPINQTSDQILSSTGAGNQNVGPGAGLHVAVVNVTGTATVRQFSLVKNTLTSLNAGWRVKIVFLFPGQTSGIGLQVFDANTVGQNLLNYATNGYDGSLVANFHYDGAQWQIDDAKAPAVS